MSDRTAGAIRHWEEFAAAVAAFLGEGPSTTRDTLLDALDACCLELGRVGPHTRYLDDGFTVVNRATTARDALGFALAQVERVPVTGPGTRRTVEKATEAAVTREEPAEADARTVHEPGPGPATALEPDPGAETGTGAGSGPAPDPTARWALRLGELREEMGRLHGRHLGSRVPGTGDAKGVGGAAAWTALHLAMLRLPDATEWRARAARTVRDCLDTEPPRDGPAVLVPAVRLPGGTPAADVRPEPRHLCGEIALPLDLADPVVLRSAAAEAPADVLEALGITSEDIAVLDPAGARLAWAARAGQALTLTRLDPELCAVDDLGMSPAPVKLTVDGHLRAYRSRLCTALKGAAGALNEAGWSDDDRLRSARELDGVLGSLLHLPPAAPESWWWRWRMEVSGLLRPLAHQAGYEPVEAPETWKEGDLLQHTETKSNMGYTARQGPQVMWLLLTPLRRIGARGTDLKGRVVRRTAPPATGGS